MSPWPPRPRVHPSSCPLSPCVHYPLCPCALCPHILVSLCPLCPCVPPFLMSPCLPCPLVPCPCVPAFPMSPYQCPPCPCGPCPCPVSPVPSVPCCRVPLPWAVALRGLPGVTGGHRTPSPLQYRPGASSPGGAVRSGAPRGSEPLCAAGGPALWLPIPERTTRAAVRGERAGGNGDWNFSRGAAPPPDTAPMGTA